MQQLISIAIVGRANVGKSTLFNRLTKTRAAIVADYPGLTRDRQYGTMQIGEYHVMLIDTGGFAKPISTMEQLVVKQMDRALEEASVVLFIVDAKEGVTAEDRVLAEKLRKLNKSIILVINKIDGRLEEEYLPDCYHLGFTNMVAISAEHNLGISELSQTIFRQLPPVKKVTVNSAIEAIRIAFLGRPNAGKSTLINQLLREERVIAHEQPGTTRSSIAINFSYRDRNYTLIDTAGMRRRSKLVERIEKISTIKTLEVVATSNVVLMLIDAIENIADQDLKLIGTVLEEGKAMVLAINKWDRLTSLQKTKVKKELERRLAFLNFVDIHFISALHGDGIRNLFKSIEHSYLNTKQPRQTAELNRILAAAIKNYPPPLVRGKEVKLRYAHGGHTAPPTIIVHGTRTEFLPESYRRYLENFLRQELRISGTPLKIIFKSKS